ADGSMYGYLQPQPAPTMTACGLLCRSYLLDDVLFTEKAPRPALAKGAEYLWKLPPGQNFLNSYYYYYSTTFINQENRDVARGGPEWNTRMRRVLLASQDWGEKVDHKHQKGSWSGEGDAWGTQIGRVGMTSFALLSLLASDPYVPRIAPG